MRTLLSMAVTLLASGCSRDMRTPEEPAKLYAQVKDRLVSAKTLAIEVSFRAPDETDPWTWTFLREGDRFRSEGRCSNPEIPFFWMAISNGRSTYLSPAKNMELEGLESTAPGEALLIIERIMRMGLGAVWTAPESVGRRELELKDMREGKSRLHGGRACRVLLYRMLFQGTQEGFDVTLWLDPLTLIPVKRHYRATFQISRPSRKEGVIQEGEETYVKVLLDGKIDPDQFKLPGE